MLCALCYLCVHLVTVSACYHVCSKLNWPVALLCMPSPYTLRQHVAYTRMQHTALSSVADWLAKLMWLDWRRSVCHQDSQQCCYISKFIAKGQTLVQDLHLRA